MRKAHPSPDHARGATGSRLSGSRLSGSLTSDGEEGEERLPAGVRDVISCAVDPLEIAASLESHGYANAVVKAKFGHQDVFSFTEELYNSAGYRPAPSSDERRPRPGGLVDLAHGAVFAAPVLVFAGAGVASRDWLSWWAVPLSLVLGFSFSQGMGYVSYARLGRSEVPGPPAAWGILSALGASAAASAGAASLWGGGIASTLFTVGMCVFMTAASWLVIANREGLFILWLLPGATGSAVYLSGFPFPLSSVEVEVIVGGSVAVTVVTARWRLPRQWRRNAPLSRQEASPAALYFLHGLASGALIAAFGLIQQERPDKQWAAVATYPLVLSLGAMEWQLRTLQARTRRAMEPSRPSSLHPSGSGRTSTLPRFVLGRVQRPRRRGVGSGEARGSEPSARDVGDGCRAGAHVFLGLGRGWVGASGPRGAFVGRRLGCLGLLGGGVFGGTRGRALDWVSGVGTSARVSARRLNGHVLPLSLAVLALRRTGNPLLHL